MPPEPSLDAALADLRAGRMVVLAGTPERGGEGTLTLAAQHCTAEAVAFMATHGGGIVSLCLTGERCDALALPPMTARNGSRFGAAFTVSIEARGGVTTGISAADRARTIRVASDPASGPSDIVRPGHILPLRARAGGVLERAAHTEAAVDLARLAGLEPAGVVCGMLDGDGRMARGAALRRLAAEHGLRLVQVADVAEHRRRHELWVEPVGSRTLALAGGRVTAFAFRETYGERTHLAFVGDDVRAGARAHVECLSAALLGGAECDCRARLREDLDALAAGAGPAVYVLAAGDPREHAASFAARPCPGVPDDRDEVDVLTAQLARAVAEVRSTSCTVIP